MALFDKSWPWFTLAGVLILVLILSFVEVRFGVDGRDTGGAEEIAALRERDDLNVLFILIDTLRADRLSAYGYERETSPGLDYLAEHGVRFDRHLAQSSWTKCSMASLWTGLNPQRTGVLRFDHVTPDAAVMPAEIFQEAGFQTVGIWRNGWVDPSFGFSQGFDVYNRPVARAAPDVRRENPTVKTGGTDTDAIDAATEFLRINGKDRWFLYLHLMDVHEYLYDEQSALFGSDYSSVYDNSIRRVSNIVGGLASELGEKGYLENTLIVITSDHGEAFRERGLEGHARKVYKESTEVPFLLSFPFKLREPVVLDIGSRNVDIWPTVLDLVGLPPLPETDGRSLRAEIIEAAGGPRAPVASLTGISHLDQTWGRVGVPSAPVVAIAEGGYRYIQSREAKGGVIEELFHRAAEPAELINVLEQQPEVAERLRTQANAYLDATPVWESGTLEIDEIQLNQLRALGYKLP